MRSTREVLTDWRMVTALAVLIAVAFLAWAGVHGVQRVDKLVERQRVLVDVVEHQQTTIDRLTRRLKQLRETLEEERKAR